MKIKVVVVDLEIPPRVKKWMLRAGIPLGVLFGGGAVAWAAGLHTWNDGDTLTSADLNGNFTNLQTQITALQAQVHPASAFRAVLSGATSIPGNAGTPVIFDNVDFDLASEYDKTKGTFTATNKGTYYLHCGVQFQPAGATQTDWQVALQKNGMELAGSDQYVSTSGGMSEAVEGVFALAAGDVVKCTAFQNSGTAQPLLVAGSVRNSFSGARQY
jgi:hypothetical protein